MSALRYDSDLVRAYDYPLRFLHYYESPHRGTAKKWSKNVALRKEVTGQQHVSNSKGAKVFPSMDKSGPVNTKEIKETRSARQLFKRV